jgi:hypothetical protein
VNSLDVIVGAERKDEMGNCESIEGYVMRLERKIENLERDKRATDLLLCGVLLGRFDPLAPHHASWIKERVNYTTDEELSARLCSPTQKVRFQNERSE